MDVRGSEERGRWMRVRAERCTSRLRSARTLTPTPLSRRDYLRVAGGRGAFRIDLTFHGKGKT
jgi:hypothetical protein